MNRGVIHEPFRPDFILLGGPGDGLPDIIPDGDGEPFLPLFEKQNKWGLETMNCVQFSRASSCEAWAVWWSKKLARPDLANLNLSDRFWYWLTGCTERGNTFGACDFNIRRGGGCAEGLWPWNAPMDRAEYGKEPPADVKAEAARLLERWEFGQLVWVSPTVEAMRAALKKSPVLWACNDGHAFCIYRVDDRIWVLDTYPGSAGEGRVSFPLEYANQLRAVYIAPFNPKSAPMPTLKAPANCLVVVVDGHGDRFMSIDGTKLFKDDMGKIEAELMARNSKPDGNGVLWARGYPVVHVKEADLVGIPRVNLKNQPV